MHGSDEFAFMEEDFNVLGTIGKLQCHLTFTMLSLELNIRVFIRSVLIMKTIKYICTFMSWCFVSCLHICTCTAKYII